MEHQVEVEARSAVGMGLLQEDQALRVPAMEHQVEEVALSVVVMELHQEDQAL